MAVVLNSPWRVAGRSDWLLSVLSVRSMDGQEHRYFLPLAIAWEGRETAIQVSADWSVAKVRQRESERWLTLPILRSLGLIETMRAGPCAFRRRDARVSADPEFDRLFDHGIEPVQRLSVEQSNTGVIFGEALFLKAYRRLRTGLAPEIEMSAYLTEADSGTLQRSPALPMLDEGDAAVAVMSLFEFRRNQGDGWTYTLNHLERFASIAQDPEQRPSAHELYVNQMQTLGRRVGELHAVLARRTENPLSTRAGRSPPISTHGAANSNAKRMRPWRCSRITPRRCLNLCGHGSPRRSRAVQRSPIFSALRKLSIAGLVKTRFHGDLASVRSC